MPVEAELQVETTLEPLPKKPCTMPGAGIVLRFAKLTKKAFTPTRGSKLAAGYDLYRLSFVKMLLEFSFLPNKLCTHQSGWGRSPDQLF